MELMLSMLRFYMKWLSMDESEYLKSVGITMRIEFVTYIVKLYYDKILI